MITDALCLLSDAQALTATAFSTNTYDCGNTTPKRRLGDGKPLVVAFQVDVAADATTGDETYQFDLVTSANANLSSPTVLESVIIARATLAAGFKFNIFWPQTIPWLRYIGVQYTLGGTTPLLTITAMIQPADMLQMDQVYAKGYTVS